ncbi:MAG TPA: catalase family peroxidase [Nitriliruptorales bacterium]
MDEGLSERLVDALTALYGLHAGYRAAHATGVLCAATFSATAQAGELSRAVHLQGEPTRAHVRFSNGNGDPTVPDKVRDGRGMAVKFYLPDGTTTDIVALSVPVFFARTPEDFLAFTHARVPDPETGKPDLTKVGAYLDEHPEAMAAVSAGLTHPIPASFLTTAYHGVHAFGFVDRDDRLRHGRYHLVPDEGEVAVPDDERKGLAPDYLRRDLVDRLDVGSGLFHLDLQLAAAEDPLTDPTAEWPEDREVVRLGQLRIDALAFDREHEGDVLVFDPTRVTDGIVLTDDPILHARRGAYSVSVARRT